MSTWLVVTLGVVAGLVVFWGVWLTIGRWVEGFGLVWVWGGLGFGVAVAASSGLTLAFLAIAFSE